ncbi:MAG: hypothetical protein ACOYMA_12005 [Bacteroidia bacterium]
MKTNIFSFLAIIFIISSCATTVGGSYYYANVQVKGKPLTKIYYKNALKGTGTAMLKIKRSEANNFAVTLKEDSCQDQTFNYTSRTFRGYAFVATAFTGVGAITDLLSGAVWKPDVSEKGISQENYKIFSYAIDYIGCPASVKDYKTTNKSFDLIYLKNGNILTGLILEESDFSYKFKPKDGEITFIKKADVTRTMKTTEN